MEIFTSTKTIGINIQVMRSCKYKSFSLITCKLVIREKACLQLLLKQKCIEILAYHCSKNLVKVYFYFIFRSSARPYAISM